MARKYNVARLIGERQALAEFTRREQPSSSVLGLLRLRVASSKSPVAPTRRVIRVNARDLPDLPQPVKVSTSAPRNVQAP
jgi:hypothetical protein